VVVPNNIQRHARASPRGCTQDATSRMPMTTVFTHICRGRCPRRPIPSRPLCRPSSSASRLTLRAQGHTFPPPYLLLLYHSWPPHTNCGLRDSDSCHSLSLGHARACRLEIRQRPSSPSPSLGLRSASLCRRSNPLRKWPHVQLRTQQEHRRSCGGKVG
jgi:hypothetical protein